MKHLTEMQLQEYLDRTLPASARRLAGAHLLSCDLCAGRLEELKLVFAGLASLPEARLSRDLAAALLPRLPQTEPRMWTPVFAAQAGAALGGVIWLAGEAAKTIQKIEFASILLFLSRLEALPRLKLNLPDFAFILPAIHLFDFGRAEVSTFNVALLAVSALALWLAGNAALLRSRPGSRE
jgi:anti-sigma factor RsiW